MVINLIVGVYIPIVRIPYKGGMTIPNMRSLDPATTERNSFTKHHKVLFFFFGFAFPLDEFPCGAGPIFRGCAWICLFGDFLRILPWKSPLNHHVGFFFTFCQHLKQIQGYLF